MSNESKTWSQLQREKEEEDAIRENFNRKTLGAGFAFTLIIVVLILRAAHHY